MDCQRKGGRRQEGHSFVPAFGDHTDHLGLFVDTAVVDIAVPGARGLDSAAEQHCSEERQCHGPPHQQLVCDDLQHAPMLDAGVLV